jgi:hypothetical protein
LPPDLRDWLPEDHLAWFVIEAIEEQTPALRAGAGITVQLHPVSSLLLVA